MRNTVNNLIRQYNTPDSLLVISSYPERGVRSSGKICAVGWVAKNTLESLRAINHHKVIVLTLIMEKEEAYVEDGILVIRCFKRNKIASYFSLIKTILRFNRVQDVLVEFEFASYGDTKVTGLFPLVCWLLKILGKKATLVLHQVLVDIKSLSGHIGFAQGSRKISFFNLFLRFFYWFLCWPVQSIVVLEEAFKRRLQNLVGMEEKILAIPLGVDLAAVKQVESCLARRKLGMKRNEFVLLYFGYLTWYKGADFLVRAVANIGKEIDNKPIKLVMAGGESTTQKAKKHYQNFVKKVYGLAEKSDSITITGFIDEKKISLYFAAADLVVLPYRTFMSSSGPLSMAFSYSKPFTVSDKLRSYFDSSDFRSALNETGIDPNDLCFALRGDSLRNKLKFLSSGNRLKRISKLSQIMSQKRDYRVLAAKYNHVIHGTCEEKTRRVAPQLSPDFVLE